MGERPLVMAAAAAAVLAGPALGAPPPASAFGRLPMVQDAAISPDGRRIAILGGEDDERVLSIVPVDGRAGVTVDVGRGEARTVRWAGNGYVLVRTSTVERWADAGTGGRYVSHRDRDVVVDAAGARVTGQLLTGNPASGRATVLPILHILPEPRPAAVVLGLGRCWPPARAPSASAAARTRWNGCCGGPNCPQARGGCWSGAQPTPPAGTSTAAARDGCASTTTTPTAVT
jgi:hypothetical protein